MPYKCRSAHLRAFGIQCAAKTGFNRNAPAKCRNSQNVSVVDLGMYPDCS